MTRPINAQMLRRRGACHGQVKKLVRLFGEGDVVPTLELFRKHARDINFGWAARKLLSGDAHLAYIKATNRPWRDYHNSPYSVDSYGNLKLALAEAFLNAWNSDGDPAEQREGN